LAGGLAAAEEVQPLETVQGWGLVVDPVGDCKFEHADGKFTIKVPGAHHDLWPVKGKVNAPLVLQEVAGDFTIEVLVEEVTKAESDTVLPGMASTASFHAGSLVIWQDAKNFVRFDRTNMNKGGRATTACYLHVYQDGERTAELAPAVPDRPTHLRLSRKGDRLMAAYSQDGGTKWTSLAEQKVKLADKLKAGVSALNNTSRENAVRFADLKIGK
jgi:regulation of enolase protein 1 (concanavalin A-like superfamily)